MSTQTHYRTCSLCEAMCGVAIDVKDGKITAIRGDDQDSFSRGHICPKAVALQDLHEDPDRLRKPLKRTADGWQEISWDEALDMAAQGLHKIRKAHGRDSLGVYTGNPNVHNHGAMISLLPFLKAVGTRNRFSATSNDQLPHMLASLEMFGHQALFPIPDLDRTDLFICLGSNPMASNGSLMSVPDFKGRLKDLRKRGGRLIVIDPRRTETADIADQFHFIRPGSDALLLISMIHTLFDEELVDMGAAGNWCNDLDLIRLASLPFSPEQTHAHTGIPAPAIRELARALATTERAVLHGRMGTSTQSFGGMSTWLIYVLNILTGKLDRAGGLMFTQPAVDLVALGAMSGQKGHIGRRMSRVRQLPEFGGEFPTSTLAEEILTPGEGQIRGFVSVAGNPVLSSPNGRRLDEALASLEFMVSIDFYLNETTRHAHLILPPTGPLERSHYDLVFNVLAIRNVAKYSPALFEPAEDARHDWQILLDLAHRLERLNGQSGPAQELGWRLFKRLGPDAVLDIALRSGPYGSPLAPLRPVLQPLSDLLIDALPERHPLRALLRMSPQDRRWSHLPKGLSLETLRANPHGVDLGPLQPALPDRLYTHDGRIALAPRRYLQDLERLHQYLKHKPEQGGLQVIGRRHVRSNNSWLHNSQRLVKGKSRCTVMLHPDDARARGIAPGMAVEVRTEVGQICLPAEVTEAIMPGVISIPHGWGHDREAIRMGVATRHAGASLNDILRDDLVDPLSGTSVLNGQRVEVVAIVPPATPPH